MKTSRFFLALLLVAALAAAGVLGCAAKNSSSKSGDDDTALIDDDDNDDNDDNDVSPDDDDDNDDNDVSPDDDDDNDDNDDNDSSPQELVLDDGSAENGLYMNAANTFLVQGFALAHHPAKLLSTKVYVQGTAGATNQVRIAVFYSTSKGRGVTPTTTTPVYVSDPFTVGTTDGWNTYDLSTVTELQTPVASGELYVGFEYTVASSGANGGPSIGLDSEGLPADDAWYQGGGSWYNVDSVAGFPGVLMVRPTVQYEGSGDDDTADDDDDNDDNDDNDDATPPVGYATGDTMPDFTEMSNSGSNVSLHDYKGKVILLDSSAMWCPPCKADTPHLETDYFTPYQNTGPGLMVLQLIGQDVSGNPPTVTELETWATTYGLTFPVLCDKNWAVGGPIGDGYIPFYWVLDTNLKIVAQSDDGGNHYPLTHFLPIVKQLLGVEEDE